MVFEGPFTTLDELEIWEHWKYWKVKILKFKIWHAKYGEFKSWLAINVENSRFGLILKLQGLENLEFQLIGKICQILKTQYLEVEIQIWKFTI